MSEDACGRCGGALEDADFGGVPFERCVACQGLLVARPDLVRLLDRLTETLGEVIGPDEIMPVPDHGEPVRCPECTSMMQRFGYMEARTVFLDRCVPCAVLWIDRDELESVVRMHAHLTERNDAQITERHALSERLSQAVRRNRHL